jgi:nitrogen fixation/metabolism regulation signal transduction histidine kinase
MTSSDRSLPTRPDAPPDDPGAELERAASELEGLADAHEECTRELETLESTVDALLDDGSVHVLVLDHDHTVTGISRGLAHILGGERPVTGRRLAAVAPPSWSGVDAALDALPMSRDWQVLPVDDDAGRLFGRRATDDDQPAVYVVRYEPPDA